MAKGVDRTVTNFDVRKGNVPVGGTGRGTDDESAARRPAHEAPIGFRPIGMDDLPAMHRWLNAGGALEWYARRRMTYDEVADHYGPCIRRERPTEGYIILLAGVGVGYIQAYRLADYPAYDAAAGVGPGAVGIDLFLGEEVGLHRGVGTRVLRAFLLDVVFIRHEVACCVVGPVERNAAAIRCYARVGFHRVKVVAAPGEDEPELIMRIGREDLEARPQPARKKAP